MQFKKPILTIFITFLSLTFWLCFADFKDQLYCNLNDSNIQLYIKPIQNSELCNTYLDAFDSLLQQKYNEIILTIKYKKEEKQSCLQLSDNPNCYRTQIYELKKDEFTQLLNNKNQLIYHIQLFEDKFYLQYHTLISQVLEPYITQLRDTLLISEHSSANNYTQNHILQIQKQIEITSAILNATTIDDIIAHISHYIYLKSQLEWK